MLNLKKLSDRYKGFGLGYIRFGGKSFYKIESDEPLQLNSYGGSDGFVLNDNDQVMIINNDDKQYKYFYDGNEISKEEFMSDKYSIDDDKLTADIIYDKCYDETLDKYYPHPWYPNKNILEFEVVNIIPFAKKGDRFKVSDNVIDIRNENSISFSISVEDCLNTPEFFKPLYDE